MDQIASVKAHMEGIRSKIDQLNKGISALQEGDEEDDEDSY